jgi:hypothetical protein
MTCTAIFRRLASLVALPRMHLVRYFGLFAPACKKRALLVKATMPEARRLLRRASV